MRTKMLDGAKFIVTVESNKKTHTIKTSSIFDNRTQKNLSEDYIHERGIKCFLNVNDLKETLNWNLNGDSAKYQFKWGQSGKETTEGIAYIFH